MVIVTVCVGSSCHVKGARRVIMNFNDLLKDHDQVYFRIGKAVNPAHQNPELPRQLEIRLAVVREIADELRKRGKEVSIESV